MKDILRAFIQIMLGDHSGSNEILSHSYSSIETQINEFILESPPTLCCQLLKRISLESNTCAPLMCNDELFEVLLKPFRQFLSSKKMFNDYVRSNTNLVSERNLIRLAELLSTMASNDVGYQYLIRSSATAANA